MKVSHLRIFFFLAVTIFFFTLVSKEMFLNHYKSLLIKSEIDGSLNNNKQIMEKFEMEIKIMTSRAKNYEKKFRKMESSNFFTKPAEDLASVKKYPEVPMTFTHRDMHMCGTTNFKLMILVFSGEKNAEVRKTIRRTWGKLLIHSDAGEIEELRWRIIFIVGRPLDEAGRDQKFFDEVMGNDLLGVHAKNSRTMQALYGALYWAINGCSFEKLLVMSDHMFLNTKSLYHSIHRLQMKSEDRLYINSMSASHKVSSEPHFGVGDMKRFDPNGAWLISRGYLVDLVPQIRIFMNSDFEGTSAIVDEFMEKKVGVDSRKSKHFLSNQYSCIFNPNFILSLQKNTSCIETLYKQFVK